MRTSLGRIKDILDAHKDCAPDEYCFLYDELAGTLPDLLKRPVVDEAYLYRQREWSLKTFGPGPRTFGIIDHIRKELKEIEAEPSDLEEWVDVVILALDGAWRTGHSVEEIISLLHMKQEKNRNRVWPDWRTAPEDKAIEHVRVGPKEGVQ